MQEYHMLCNIG